MTQVLQAQLASITSMDVYRQQNSAEQPYLSSTKRSRNRGIILSRQGWQRLMQAGALCNELGERYTYEQLSERSHLNERTVSRLLSCDVKVDKSTVQTFFRAFNLLLETGDYALPNSNRMDAVMSGATIHTDSTKQSIQVEQLAEELAQLKQRMREYERLFHRLGLNENHFGHHLRA